MNITHPPLTNRTTTTGTTTATKTAAAWDLTTPQGHDIPVTVVDYADAPEATHLALLVDRHISMRDDLRLALTRGIYTALATTGPVPAPAT